MKHDMTRTFLLCVYVYVMTAYQVTGGIKMDLKHENTYFEMTCSDISTSFIIYWYKDGFLMMKTYYVVSPGYTMMGKYLKNITEDATPPGRHQITITDNGHRMGGYWRCCRYNWLFCRKCSKWHYIDSSTDSGNLMTPSLPSEQPDIDNRFIENASLTLTNNPVAPIEGQHMTLSCRIDMPIETDEWVVLWFRNRTAVFSTDNNTSLKSAKNLTLQLVSSLNDSKSYNDILDSLDDVLPLITVSVDDFMHSIIIPLSSSLIGRSLWNCANPYVANFSNTLTVEVTAQTTSIAQGYTTTGRSSMDTNTSPSSTAYGQRGNKTTYIIAGSVGGVVVLVLIVVMVIIVLRLRKKKEKRSSDGVFKSTNESTKEKIVMEDNVLYEGSRDNTCQNRRYPDDDLVVEDNVLYVSVSQEKGQKIPSGVSLVRGK